ncbi:MAG: primosomal protein N', partial [Desulfovibrionaceae bacterium]|nr:primosomal protein N' [Desulfovibrionaceae bacterium]
MFHAVALLSPPYSTLTYAAPADLPETLWQPGLRAAVPLGNGALRVGVLLDAGHSQTDLPPDITPRPLIWPLERSPLLSADHLDMIRQLAVRQATTPGNILGHILPPGLRTTQVRLRRFTGGKPQMLSLKALAQLPDAERAILAAAFRAGLADLAPARTDAAESEVCELHADPPWTVR